MKSKIDSIPTSTESGLDTVVIDSHATVGTSIREMFARRELLEFLIWRDIKVRYKQTVLGVAWALIVPLAQAIIFSIVFGRLAKIEPDGEYPYVVFVLAGLIPWTFFSQALLLGSQSLINQQHLLTKVYFPRLFVPTAAVGGCLVDFGISLLLYAGVLGYYHVTPTSNLLYLPLLLVLTTISVLGLVYLLAALTVSYRDFRYVIPFAVQALMYASPIVYPVNLVPVEYQWALGLNPIAGIVDAFRSTMLDKAWNFHVIFTSMISTIFLFFIGVNYFRRTERRFADIA